MFYSYSVINIFLLDASLNIMNALEPTKASLNWLTKRFVSSNQLALNRQHPNHINLKGKNLSSYIENIKD